MTITPLFTLGIILPLAIFYVWMCRDMVTNHHLSSSPWMAFVMLNVFAAAMYYVSEYRRR